MRTKVLIKSPWYAVPSSSYAGLSLSLVISGFFPSGMKLWLKDNRTMSLKLILQEKIGAFHDDHMGG